MNQSSSIIRKWLWMALFAILSISVYAQKKVEGQITDNNGVPLSGVLVAEIYSGKSFSGDIVQSRDDGKFTVFINKKGSSLYITNIGYKPQEIRNIADSTGFIYVVMAPDPNFTLKEVTVSAYKKAVTVKSDRIVYDMATNPMNENNNTLQALRFVPLVIANDNGFSIIGKNITQVYINNRKSNLTPEALFAYLQTLPASSIDKIEVITAPGSSFRGEGNFGVIHIKLKNAENEGLRGFANGAVWRTHHFKENANLNLSYNKNKLSTDLSLGSGHYNTYRTSKVQTDYLQTPLITNQKYKSDTWENSFFANLRADYVLDKTKTVGIVVNSSLENTNGNNTGFTTFKTNGMNALDSTIDMNKFDKKRNRELAANANYRYHSKDGKRYFTGDLDYLYNYNKSYSRNLMNRIDDNGEAISNYKNIEQSVPQISNVCSGKIEYGNNLDKICNLKLGADAYYSKVSDDNKYSNWQEGAYHLDPVYSNHFKVREFTPSLFIEAEKSWNYQFDTQLGTRLEYTNYKGKEYTTNEDFTTDYFKVLPYLNINYNPTKIHSLSYSFSCRVSRPSYRNLNPFKEYISPTEYSVGNPFLKPENVYYQEFTYGFKSKYFLSASYELDNHGINFIQIVKEGNLIENTMDNGGKRRNFYMWFSTSFRYFKGNANSNINLTYHWKRMISNSPGIDIDFENNSCAFSLQNNYTLSNRYKWWFDCGVVYTSKIRNTYTRMPASFNWNAQLRKGIKDFQFSLYCNIVNYMYDHKWTQVRKMVYENNYLRSIDYAKSEPNSFGFRVSYSFGNSKVKRVGERSTSNSEVRNRVY